MTATAANIPAPTDNFDDAFAKLTAPVSETPATPPANESVTPPANESVTPPANEPVTPPVTDPVTPPANEPVTPPVTDPATPPANTPAPAEDLFKKLTDALSAAKPVEPTPVTPEPAQPEPEIYTPDEKKTIASYREEWSDVAEGEALVRREEYAQLTNHIFKEVFDFFAPKLELLDTLVAERHSQQITQEITDYDKVREPVIEWASKQPVYLRVAYEHVIKQGTADEVVDLVKRWRQETGSTVGLVTPEPTTTTTTTPPTPAARKTATELPSKAKQAADLLAPVSSNRSTPTPGVDPTDFDGAFEAALKARSQG